MTIKQQGGIFGRNPTFNDVTVENNMTIDGTTTVDKLGVGTNSPNTQLEIVNNTNNLARVRVSTTDTTPNNYRGYEFAQGSSFKGGLLQDQSTDSISIFTPLGGQSVIVYNNGNVSLNGGNLAFNSGNGIDFSATSGTGTSELFDDYEEGNWTPVLNSFTQSGGGTVTTSGIYTKIGRQVTVNCDITCSGGASLSATALTSTVTGLPFLATSAAGFSSSWQNTATITSYGNGLVYTSTVYSPAWSSSANQGISFTATYFV